MAFTYTRTGKVVFGNKWLAHGTFTNTGGDTGGNIDTGLKKVEGMWFSGSGASVIADATSINETLPCDGSAVTIVTTANATGFWYAFGWGA
jgi:hypothetical protein